MNNLRNFHTNRNNCNVFSIYSEAREKGKALNF